MSTVITMTVTGLLLQIVSSGGVFRARSRRALPKLCPTDPKTASNEVWS